ncbi:hypothetical protein ABIB62_001234 [Mucilaginibacter sp. UYP25]|uniref:DUF4304 domain-containing protein n=1 Tax=unclassified Mucilaginibacter TaxID=2617802 RepID=UPI003390D2CF
MKVAMTGTDKRLLMDEAIKSLFIPFLRTVGFKGSYPHFTRIKNDRINLLTFQFSSYSSKFVVEIANCPTTGSIVTGKEIEPSKCRVHYEGRRLRIGSIKNKTDYWFDFSKESFFINIYKRRAKEIISLWPEAEEWWLDNPA